MPRWGARIINRSTGSVQIDDLYENLALISKQSQNSTPVAVPGVTGQTDATFTVVANEIPAVAFTSTSHGFLWNTQRNNTNNTWTFIIRLNSVGPVGVTFYAFDKPPALGSGWGVRITRGGVVKYDSRHRYARVRHTVRGNVDLVGTPYGGAGPSANLEGGRTYAVLIGTSPGRSTRYIQIQGGTQQGYIDSRYASVFGVAVNGAVITSQHIPTYFDSTFLPVPPSPPPGNPYDNINSQCSWAILDVTGF